MAFIDRDSGPGGIPEMPMLPENDVMANITELPQQPGVFEFDDGSAVVGDYDDGMGVVPEVAFDGNLADVIDSAILGRIASDLLY